mgnify:CR=1 FL=1
MVVFERGATELIGYSAPNMSAVGTYPVPLHQVRPSTINPRKQFDQAKLVELAEGIMRHGLLEPIVVRVATAAAIDDGRGEIVLYEIVAGERRYRATWLVALARCMGEPVAEVVALSEEAREAFREQAGREFIEARNLGEVPDGVALELALVENLQRADLDPIEEAEGYAALNRVAGLSQSAIGKAVNRSQPAIANAMRLLDLPDDVRERIRVGKLSASHGVALAKWKQYPEFVSKLAENAAKHGYTSKQMEQVEPGDYMANGAAERLHGGNGFDSAVCAGCPFGAYIPSKQQYSYDRGYCMKPSHFKQLREEAEAERLAAHEAKAAEKIGAEEAAALPKLAGMKYDTYRDLRSHTTPPGCSADCECRAKGIGEGGRVVAIWFHAAQARRAEGGALRRIDLRFRVRVEG